MIKYVYRQHDNGYWQVAEESPYALNILPYTYDTEEEALAEVKRLEACKQ